MEGQHALKNAVIWEAQLARPAGDAQGATATGDTCATAVDQRTEAQPPEDLIAALIARNLSRPPGREEEGQHNNLSNAGLDNNLEHAGLLSPLIRRFELDTFRAAGRDALAAPAGQSATPASSSPMSSRARSAARLGDTMEEEANSVQGAARDRFLDRPHNLRNAGPFSSSRSPLPARGSERRGGVEPFFNGSKVEPFVNGSNAQNPGRVTARGGAGEEGGEGARGLGWGRTLPGASLENGSKSLEENGSKILDENGSKGLAPDRAFSR